MSAALFDNTLDGPPVISVKEAEQRSAFLRTHVGRLRAFKVERAGQDVIVQAPSAAQAIRLADRFVWEQKQGKR